MRKRVEIGELKLGMYICELDRQWPDSPFDTRGFALKSIDQIKLLARHCRFVFVETDLETPEPALVPPGHSKSASFTHLERPELELEILKKYVSPGSNNGNYVDLVAVEEEIDTIRDTHKQAVALIDNMMQQLRQGKNLNTVATREVVSALTHSIVRNPDALVCFTKMKETHVSMAQHGLRCCILALALGRHLGMGQQQLYDLGIGALLHDIGKTRVPIEILECGHELNEEEIQLYRKHVPAGIIILENTKGIPEESIGLVCLHHEHYDGNGYLHSLSGNQISQFGHIGGIVNFFDGLTHPRPGRRQVSAHIALKMIYEQRGRMFHPHLAEEFIRCMGIYPIGSIVEMRSGEIGVVVALNRTRRLKPRVAIVHDPAAPAASTVSTVNLADHRNQRGEALEIANVLDENVCDFDPSNYLPVVA